MQIFKNIQGSMPPDPLESFLLPKLLELISAGEKTMLEKVTKFDTPSLNNFLNTPLISNIFKRLIYARFRD